VSGRVLLVDPEPFATELIQRRLRAAGFEVACAPSAELATRAIEDATPDVILLAMSLPDSDGFTLLGALRRTPALEGVSIAVVATLQRDPESLGRALELGADDYLRKPIETIELVARVRSLFRLRRQIAELESKTKRLAELNAELERVAISDALTGLYNRRYLEQRLSEEIDRSRRYGQPLSLFVGDVDFFKKVNDTYGHAAGDEVLRAVARTMTKTVRRVDLVARLGGEEFVIVTPSTDRERARIAAERVRAAVEQARIDVPSPSGPLTIQVTMSLGVATFGDRSLSAADLVAAADQALYRAKSSGRNRVEVAGGEPAA
jgi:two-component system, cell cycle response regulator